MKQHTSLQFPQAPLTRRRLLTRIAPLGLGAALLGTSWETTFAATGISKQKSRPLASGGLASPAMAPSQDGRLELFALGSQDFNLYHRWQLDDLSWSGWYSHGAAFPFFFDPLLSGSVCLTQTPAGLLQLFTVAGGNPAGSSLYRMGQVVPSGSWTALQDLGDDPNSIYTDPAIAVDGNGNVEVFLFSSPPSSSQGTLYRGIFSSNGSWSGWTPFPNPPGTSFINAHYNYNVVPATAVNPDGRLELFCIGYDGNLWHTWQTSVGGSWAPWYSHGNPGVDLSHSWPLTIAANADGRLDCFLLGNPGPLYHLPQHTLNGGWGTWASLGQPSTGFSTPNSQIAISWSADGRRELFIADTNLWHIWQTDLNGNWSGWYSHGVPAGTQLEGGVVVHLNRNNEQELFADGEDGNLYSIKQVVVNGGWSTWINFGQP